MPRRPTLTHEEMLAIPATLVRRTVIGGTTYSIYHAGTPDPDALFDALKDVAREAFVCSDPQTPQPQESAA